MNENSYEKEKVFDNDKRKNNIEKNLTPRGVEGRNNYDSETKKLILMK